MFGGGLLHDAMHDILKGVAPLEVKLLLSKCTTDGLITLDELNDRLVNFNFGYTESDKPVPIFSRVLQPDNSSRASASQLVCMLPFLMGEQIPQNNEHWICFLLLRKIIDIVLRLICTHSLCTSLKVGTS